MALSAGRRFGPYEIIALVGSGGMGEVYRATDTKLNREAAIKVLPDSVAGDPDRVARFRREAQVLASLSHPNIAAIYGLEEFGEAISLALEFVDGADLMTLLTHGAIPVGEALAIAKQIAEALEAAHERSIIHRDLVSSDRARTCEPDESQFLSGRSAQGWYLARSSPGRAQRHRSRPRAAIP